MNLMKVFPSLNQTDISSISSSFSIKYQLQSQNYEWDHSPKSFGRMMAIDSIFFPIWILSHLIHFQTVKRGIVDGILLW